MEVRDFMTKENLEMIGLAVMCDRYAFYWRNHRGNIRITEASVCSSVSSSNFMEMVQLGKDISVIMEFFEKLEGECKIKDIVEYLRENGIRWTAQRTTATCRRLCASGFLKQRYSDPYKITVRNYDYSGPKVVPVANEIEVRDSLYSLA